MAYLLQSPDAARAEVPLHPCSSHSEEHQLLASKTSNSLPAHHSQNVSCRKVVFREHCLRTMESDLGNLPLKFMNSIIFIENHICIHLWGWLSF